MLTVILLVLFAMVVGFCGFEGLWSNAVRFVNVMLAALIAMNFYEPFARFMQGFVTSAGYHVDMAALALIFGITLGVMRLLTDSISQVKVRFLPILDKAGGIILAALTGWILLGFIMTIMHTAPLGKNFLGFDGREKMFLGFAPDRNWLGFTNRVSQGSLGKTPPANDEDAYTFDPDGSFAARYQQRRADYEKLEDLFAEMKGSR